MPREGMQAYVRSSSSALHYQDILTYNNQTNAIRKGNVVLKKEYSWL